MSSRFFVSNIQNDHVSISDTQVHHIRNVMRLDVGDRLTLFDGQDHQAFAEIESISRSEVALRIIDRQEVSCELASAIHIGMPLPKSERVRFLIEKLTELGVKSFQPVITERSEFNKKSAEPEKLERYVVEASKQCGRNRLMEIRPVVQLKALLEQNSIEETRLIAVRGGEDLASVNSGNAPPSNLNFFCLIGPEGGCTDDEVAAARNADFLPISLGPTILRMETAAMKVASLLARE